MSTHVFIGLLKAASSSQAGCSIVVHIIIWVMEKCAVPELYTSTQYMCHDYHFIHGRSGAITKKRTPCRRGRKIRGDPSWVPGSSIDDVISTWGIPSPKAPHRSAVPTNTARVQESPKRRNVSFRDITDHREKGQSLGSNSTKEVVQKPVTTMTGTFSEGWTGIITISLGPNFL